MHITDIKTKTVSIASEIRNAYIDFSKMTVSVIAMSTDVIRDGNPLLVTDSTQTVVIDRSICCAIGLSPAYCRLKQMQYCPGKGEDETRGIAVFSR